MHVEHQRQVNRRSFIATGLMAGGAVAAATGLESASWAAEQNQLGPEAVVLFQGDSITDAGRNRQATAANDNGGLGRGYPNLIAGALLADHPQLKLRIFNRGISGNKVPDLAARWQEDAVSLKPNILSVLIGVNDIWHKLNGNYAGTVQDYESGYRRLLEQTAQAISGVRIIVCEPFVLRCGAINDKWFPEFEQRRAVAKKLAEDMRLTFVPFQTMFDEAVKQTEPAYWAADGVHPTLAGHALMAKTWRAVVGI